MLYWIFDLDNTLYQIPHNGDFSYNNLVQDDQLNYQLFMLPLKKIIFTNGTMGHANMCLKRMNIDDQFNKIIARDSINDLKPNNSAYLKFMNSCNIMPYDKCIFFDDLPENLIEAKQFGWITVLINKNRYVHEDIDFYFPNIYLALNYLITKIHKNT
jgi:pyrimidine 5'-nucleotidase